MYGIFVLHYLVFVQVFDYSFSLVMLAGGTCIVFFLSVPGYG